MILLDVNVMVAAYRTEIEHHRAMSAWLADALAGPVPIGLLGMIAAGFARIVTSPRLFSLPASADQAMDYVAALRRHGSVVSVHPSRRHLEVFEDLCRRTRATGNLVPDAYLAAVAIDTGSTIASADADFGRFPAVRWTNPLA